MMNTTSISDPKTSLLEQMGLVQTPPPPPPTTTTTSSLNSMLNLLKAAQENNSNENAANNTVHLISPKKVKMEPENSLSLDQQLLITQKQEFNSKNNHQTNTNNIINSFQSNNSSNNNNESETATNLRLISHLPSLLAENLQQLNEPSLSSNISSKQQQPLSSPSKIIEQINKNTNSTNNITNGHTKHKLKNISNLKRPIETIKQEDWKNVEKPVAIRNPGESIMYECRWCDHKSRRRNDLEDHERRHMEKMNFGCHLCPYKAKQKFTMKHHMYKVHQTKFDASKMLVFD